MEKTLSLKALSAALIAVVACLIMGVCAVAPQQAFAAELVAGSVVDKSVSGPEITSVVSGAAGKLAVSHKAYSDVEGYECQIARNKSFTNKVTSKRYTGAKVTFSNLAKGKKYFVRVRAYTTINGVLTYSAWTSPKSAVVAIKNKSSRIKGTWKITGSNISSISSVIKRNKRISSSAKATLTFKTNGVIVLTDYDKAKTKLTSSWGKWVALSKTKGQTILSGLKIATITVKSKGKKLVLNAGGKKIYCAKL